MEGGKVIQFIKSSYPMILIFLGAVLSTAGGVLYQIKSSRTSKQIIELQNKSLNHITGGDSFCYLRLSSDGHFTLIHEGEYPLYDVSIRIVDVEQLEKGNLQLNQTPLGTIIPKSAVMIPYKFPYQNKTNAQYSVFFVARNGMFSETLDVKKVNGLWKSAVKVSPGLAGYGQIKPFTTIDAGFNEPEQIQK